MPRETQVRWPQFGLRGLLLGTGIVAAWLALTCSRARNQAVVVREVQQHGGTVWFADDEPKFVQFWQDPVRSRSTNQRAPEWLRRTLGEEFFREVVQIDFDAASKFPRDAEQFVDRLERLPRFETLRIGSQEAAESCLPELSRVKQLRNLTIESYAVGDDELQVVGGLRQLETLCLPSSGVTDKGAANLLNLERLRCLKLYSLGV